jgi:Mg2+/Co2+ transporter CorC
MYYLIEHDRTTKKTECKEYGDYTKAQMTGLKKEQQYFLNNRHEMEVVVFEANSLEDLKRTHSRYFIVDDQKENIAGTLLAVSLVGLAVYLINKK